MLATRTVADASSVGRYADAVVTPGRRNGLVAVGALVVIGVALVASGAFAQRDDPIVPHAQLGETITTSRADVTVDAFEAGEEPGEIAVTFTVRNLLRQSLAVDDVVLLVDDAGELARYGTTTVVGGAASTAQPGVEETFTTVYDPDRAPEGEVRLQVFDATFTPRDETAFGIGSNMYDERVVAIVSMP